MSIEDSLSRVQGVGIRERPLSPQSEVVMSARQLDTESSRTAISTWLAVWGSGFGVEGLGFGVEGLEFRV